MITATIDAAQVVEPRRSQNEDAPTIGKCRPWNIGRLEWVATGQWYTEWSNHCTTCYRYSAAEESVGKPVVPLIGLVSCRSNSYNLSRMGGEILLKCICICVFVASACAVELKSEIHK